MSFNKVIIVGHLGRDPELRYTTQGMPVCSFTMATTEKRKDRSGEFQDVTTWFKVTIWGRQAETASQYLTKGKQVYIEGRLRIDEWTDREGKNRYTLEVNASDVQFLSARGEEGLGATAGGIYERPAPQTFSRSTAPTPAPRQDYMPPEPDIRDEDIPF